MYAADIRRQSSSKHKIAVIYKYYPYPFLGYIIIDGKKSSDK